MLLLALLIEKPLNLRYQLPLSLIEHVKPLGLKPRFEIGDFELYISHFPPLQGGSGGGGRERISKHSLDI